MVKNLPVIWKTQSLIPGSGRSPGEGNGNPLQYSCLGNPPEEPGDLQSRRSQELDMTEWLNNREWSQELLAKGLTHGPQTNPWPFFFGTADSSEVKVTQSCPTLCNPMESPRPEYWSGLPFPSLGESSQPRDRTQVSCIAGVFFTTWATREAQSPTEGQRDKRVGFYSSGVVYQPACLCSDSWGPDIQRSDTALDPAWVPGRSLRLHEVLSLCFEATRFPLANISLSLFLSLAP